MSKKPLKIVVTGGPGGGKTTALDLFQREYMDQLNVVPEAASLMFSAGMIRETDSIKMKLSQLAIYKMQKNLEESFSNLARGSLLLCDRGTLDGLAYWPDSEEDYFRTLNTSFKQELSEYHAVIFFQTSAAKGTTSPPASTTACSYSGNDLGRIDTLFDFNYACTCLRSFSSSTSFL